MTSDPPSSPRLCVDASLVLRRVMPDEQDHVTNQLWQSWQRQGIEILGPALLYAEVLSSIRLAIVTGRLSIAEGEIVRGDFNELAISRLDRNDLYGRA